MDFSVLFAVLVGSGLGYWFFATNKNILMNLFANLRLLTDAAYLQRRIEMLRSPAAFADLRYYLDFLPAHQHYQAMDSAHRTVLPALKVTYRVMGKYLLQYFAILALVPALIFIFLGTAQYVLASLFLAIVISVVVYAFFVWQPGKLNFEQYKTILQHAYTTAGFRQGDSRAQVNEQAITSESHSPISETFAATQTQSSPIYANMNPLHQTQPYTAAAIAQAPAAPAFLADPSPEEEIMDPEVARIMHPKEPSEKPNRFTFNNLWWGTDLLACNIVIISYWFTQARTMVDFIFMPILLILFVQVFFAPMWLVVKVAKKLIAAEYQSNR